MWRWSWYAHEVVVDAKSVWQRCWWGIKVNELWSQRCRLSFEAENYKILMQYASHRYPEVRKGYCVVSSGRCQTVLQRWFQFARNSFLREYQFGSAILPRAEYCVLVQKFQNHELGVPFSSDWCWWRSSIAPHDLFWQSDTPPYLSSISHQ